MWARTDQGQPAPSGGRRPPIRTPKAGGRSNGAGKPPRPPRPIWISIIKWLAIAGLVGVAIVAATVALTFWMYGRDPNLPRIEKLADYHPKQVTTILDHNDNRIGEIYTERRTFVTYEKIPPVVVDAFIAAEDNNYWKHSGIDYTGMVRAFFANLKSGKKAQGASTITQQVVKNFLLTPERTFKRKIQEIILARRLEQSLTKQEIMTLYLNQIYFGGGRYGVQEASRFYFGKDINDPKNPITPGEAALLASMPKEPEAFYKMLFDPKKAGRVKSRQQYVLDNMVKLGKLQQADAQKWINEPIRLVKDPFPFMSSAPEWTDVVRAELKNRQIDPDTSGAVVRTTLDPGLQLTAEKALQNGLRAVDARKKLGRAKRHLEADKMELELAKAAKRLPKSGPAAKETYEAIVTKVDDKELTVDLGKWVATLALGTDEDERYNPPGEDGKVKTGTERFKVGDVVDVVLAGKADDKKVRFAPGPEGAVVIIDVKTRKVRALVGGYETKTSGFNRATMAKRQPGSSFKTIVYTTALDSGKYTPASKLNDAPEVFDKWRPKNYESGKFLGPILLRNALAKSINTISIHMTYDLKPETVVEMAHKMGITSELPKEMSIALGSGEVTPLEMTNAVATIAAGGVAMAPSFVEAINGKMLPPSQGTQVLRPEVAYVATNMFQSVVQEGTATKAKVLNIPIAGKTGTSNESKDVWFIGFTPDYIIGVWIGNDDATPLGSKETGGTTAVPVFVEIMKAMNQPAKQFPRPAHVVEKTIDKETGLLAPDGAPKGTTRQEVFVEGTEPTEIAPMPGEVTEQTSVTGDYSD
ncbi:MAG TPA: PBP1A family penicillin-binding protein [Kofleriaceae bacterium]|nr:PBP1A family penicillin-binding protein [Kofleriaceae bacterium]